MGEVSFPVCAKQSKVTNERGSSLIETMFSMAIAFTSMLLAFSISANEQSRLNVLLRSLDGRLSLRSIDRAIGVYGRAMLPGTTYLSQGFATQLGLNVVTVAKGPRGSMFLLNRSVTGLSTDDTLDDGFSALTSSDYQTLLFLIKDPSVSELVVATPPPNPSLPPDQQPNAYYFPSNTTSGSFLTSGSSAGYTPGDVIAVSSAGNNTLMILDGVAADGTVSFHLPADAVFPVGVFQTTMPVSMFVPGMTIARVRVGLFGYDADAQQIGTATLAPDGTFTNRNTFPLKTDQLLISGVLGPIDFTKPLVPLAMNVQASCKLWMPTFMGSTKQVNWNFLL